MSNKKFVLYLLSSVFLLFLSGCFTKSLIVEAEHCNPLGLSSYQSIDLIIDHIPYKTKEITYYSEDGKNIKYISVRPKFSRNNILIYPDYSELNPIVLPSKRAKIDPLTLKKYKASRITYYFKNQTYDCIRQEYFSNIAAQETQKNNADLCRFINRPAKELLTYLTADSNNTVLTGNAPYSLEIFKWYTDIKIELNKEESILIKTIPNISINKYDQLKEDNVTLAMVAQFPIGGIEYYSNKNKKVIKTNCFISTN